MEYRLQQYVVVNRNQIAFLFHGADQLQHGTEQIIEALALPPQIETRPVWILLASFR